MPARSDPFPVPPVWGVYTAAVTLALTVRDPDERAAAARLVREIGDEMLPAGRALRKRARARGGGFGGLIRQVLEERLDGPDELADAA